MKRLEPLTPTYRAALALCTPIVRLWGRIDVDGLEHIPLEGPLILAGNHDSYWDPVVVGIAAIKRRQVRALSKSELWKIKGMPLLLNGMGQIPVDRGAASHALARTIEELRDGACIGIFPEGTRSLGRELKPRSGLGRIVAAVPEAVVVPVAIEGTTDIPRFPKRPRLRVRFLPPAEGLRAGEKPSEMTARILAEVRELAPISPAGRKPKLPPAPE